MLEQALKVKLFERSRRGAKLTPVGAAILPAVLAFADQAGLQVLFDSQRLEGLQSTAVKGQYSVQEGLARLLGNAPVEYRFNGERQVTLTRVEQSGAALALGTTTITGLHPNDWVYSSPRSVSVVGREQLDRNPPRHAAEMLEEAPGVYSAVSQQDPGLSVNIRGIQDYGRVNMSVDGMRQNYQQSGHQQRSGTLYVDPELLSEVVIEKGATSTMGGAGVIGGVANFRTVEAADLLKGGKEIGGRIRLTTGLGGRSNGTHFIGSSAFAVGTESHAPDAYKEMLLTSRAADIVHTPAVSGVPASFMRQSLENAGFDLAALQGKGEVNFGSKLKPLSDEAKAWKTVWSAGQGVGEIDDLPSVDELVARLDAEYREAREQTAQRALLQWAVLPALRGFRSTGRESSATSHQ